MSCRKTEKHLTHIIVFSICRVYREHSIHLLCSAQNWEWRNPLVQYALMDYLFDHNICGERPHEHTSSITHRHTKPHTHTHTHTTPHKHTHTQSNSPYHQSNPHISVSTWVLHIQKKTTHVSVLNPSSTTEMTSPSSPALLHPYSSASRPPWLCKCFIKCKWPWAIHI